MLIVSPSYKRAHDVKIRQWFFDITLAVHNFESNEYREKQGGNIMVLPDSARGNMALVRQAILDQAGADEWVCMMDDDIIEFGYFGKATQQENWMAYDRDEFLDFLDSGCRMAEEVGTNLWGVNVSFDPRFYREYTPISLSSPVLGTFCVQKVTKGIQYDARLGLKEDYDMFLQHLNRSHKVLRLNRYYYKAAHLTVSGGCGAYRVMEEEKKQAEIFTKKWGKGIIKWNPDRSTNPRINSPIAGV
jgi:hypothetical protein